MTKNKIVMVGECDFKDIELREVLDTVMMNITKINNRTKAHTIYIKKLEKDIKQLMASVPLVTNDTKTFK